MKVALIIDTTEEAFIRCIRAAHEKREGEALIGNIKPFSVGDIITDIDVSNMLAGSSLGQLAKDDEPKMTIV